MKNKIFFTSELLLFSVLVIVKCLPQQVTVELNTAASPATGGWYPWYEIHSEPEDPKHLIVCGSRWESGANALSGFVYSSSDGGKTWRVALEDRSSSWVSEHSCAFGVNGRAYFVSEASKVDLNGVHHHEEGTTRIFVSDDAGETWREAAQTGWADYSASTVDTVAGPDQNRLFTFFNASLSKPPLLEQQQHNGNRLGLFKFNASDKLVNEVLVSPRPELSGYKDGSPYPFSAIVLNDGTLISFYYVVLETAQGRQRALGAVRTTNARTQLSDPVIVSQTAIKQTGLPCFGYTAAYDSLHNRVYVAYAALEQGQCSLMIAASEDNGATWFKAHQIAAPETESHAFYQPAMTFNPEGMLGLIWRDTPTSDCWYFSHSSDQGLTFAAARSLSLQCRGAGAKAGEKSCNAFLWSFFSRTDDANRTSSLTLEVLDVRNQVWRNSNSITATSDGAFHPVWVEKGMCDGELRTANVRVMEQLENAVGSVPSRESHNHELYDVSQNVSLLYGGKQHYDAGTGTFAITVTLRNRGSGAIPGPIYLKAANLVADFGQAAILNADNKKSGSGAIWNLTQALHSGVLLAGGITRPYTLLFRLKPGSEDREGAVKLLSMQLSVLASSSVAAETAAPYTH